MQRGFGAKCCVPICIADATAVASDSTGEGNMMDKSNYTTAEVAAVKEELASLPDLTNQQLAALLAAAVNDLNATKINARTLEMHIDEIQCFLIDRVERGADLGDGD
jgi:hypothetical protein